MNDVSTRPVCLQDIADRANVSRATVSLALRNHASIPVQTRARIQQVAAVLEYRPNPMVSALMTYQRIAKPARRNHLTLAMLLPHSRSGAWRSCFSPRLLEAAATRAQEHGYRLEEFWLDDLKLVPARCSEMLYARGIPGVLLAPSSQGVENLEFEWQRFSSVEIGTSLSGPRPHRIALNHFDAIRSVFQGLRISNYERVGLVLKASQEALTAGLWNAGFLFEQQKLAARKRIPPLLVPDPYWCRSAFLKWLEAKQPEVVLGCGVEIPGWLESAGYRVPEDMGFVQLDVQEPGGGCTGLDANAPALGSAAVDLLVDLVRRNERGLPVAPRTVLLESAWLEGTTIRKGLSAMEAPLPNGTRIQDWRSSTASGPQPNDEADYLAAIA